MAGERFPGRGRDRWYTNKALRAMARATQTLEAERSVRNVAEFCTAFYTKLAESCRPMANGYGWAVFNAENTNEASGTSGVMTLPRCEVLLLNSARPGMNGVPLIRLITREPVHADTGALWFLTEDVSIRENGHVLYYVDALQYQGEDGSVLAMDAMFDRTRAPLFFVNSHNELVIENRRGPTTPLALLQAVDDDGRFSRVYPYGGKYGNITDDLYGLERAWSILESVQPLYPSEAFDAVA